MRTNSVYCILHVWVWVTNLISNRTRWILFTVGKLIHCNYNLMSCCLSEAILSYTEYKRGTISVKFQERIQSLPLHRIPAGMKPLGLLIEIMKKMKSFSVKINLQVQCSEHKYIYLYQICWFLQPANEVPERQTHCTDNPVSDIR